MKLLGLFATIFLLQTSSYALTMTTGEIGAVFKNFHTLIIKVSEMAKEQGASAEVQAFADKTVMGVKESCKNLDAAMAKSGAIYTPSLFTRMGDKHSESLIKKMGELNGEDFDRVYIKFSIAMSEDVLLLIDEMMMLTNDEPLKDYLTKTKPEVQAHLEAARALDTEEVAI